MRELWQTRYNNIIQQYPSVDSLDWMKVFKADPTILGNIVNDILKVDQAAPGKPGKRPSLDVVSAKERIRQFEGQDYSLQNFCEAFREITLGRSIRNISVKTGLNRNYVHRLLEGKLSPTPIVMEQIAKAYNHSPGYFMEYRIAYIVGGLLRRFDSNPEMGISVYRRLRALER
jgi:transcriptional regulator with XRE-family HTH domain